MPDIGRILKCDSCGCEHLDFESSAVTIRIVPNKTELSKGFALTTMCSECIMELMDLMCGQGSAWIATGPACQPFSKPAKD